jgi:hypothetical protein
MLMSCGWSDGTLERSHKQDSKWRHNASRRNEVSSLSVNVNFKEHEEAKDYFSTFVIIDAILLRTTSS